MEKELKLIKKYYGEEMMHFARDNFATILEQEGKLYEVLSSKFAHNKRLYRDLDLYELLDDFKIFIYDSLDNSKRVKVETELNPFELMNEAGYNLYECKSEGDIQKFKKYFAEGEELCTFRGGRLNSCYVFFAVKKNVDEIKREAFNHPQREDFYGTSVISIQFSKGIINNLSIKNRYNHTVNNPDATFGNNLERIIPGLTYAFNKMYHLNTCSTETDFEYNLTVNDYILASDGRFYKYNYEINNIQYCPNNIIIDNGKVIDNFTDTSRYILLDYFIFDLKDKKVFLYDKTLKDSFVDGLNDIKKIEIKKDKIYKIHIHLENGIAKIEYKNNNIIRYENNVITEIGESFLEHDTSLKEIKLLNVITIGDKFLYKNNTSLDIDISNTKKIGHNFLRFNINLDKLNLPNVTHVGDHFLYGNIYLSELNMPKVRKIGNGFLSNNRFVTEINFPNLKEVGDGFFMGNYNRDIRKLNFPKLKRVGDGFFHDSNSIEEVNMPTLVYVNSNFLKYAPVITIYAPNLIAVGPGFMEYNQAIVKIELPSITYIEDRFMSNCCNLKEVILPNVKKIEDCFLGDNTMVEEINLPKVEEIGTAFIHESCYIKRVILPNLKSINGPSCFHMCPNIEEVYMPFINTEELDSSNFFQVDKKVFIKNR